MRRRHRIIRHGIAAAGVFSTLATASSALANKADDTVRFAYLGSLASVDPYFNNQVGGVILAKAVWDTLIDPDSQTGAYKGNLATAWRQVDEKTLEFDLRQGVRFHNGPMFDADDVVYTLSFAAKPENKSIQLSRLTWLDRVEKLGPYKVRIVAKKPFPAAIAVLAYMSILPHGYYAQVGPKGMNAKPVGTGPYRVVENALGKRVLLERNPDYFKGGPKRAAKIGKAEIRWIPDEQTEIAEAVAGGVDLIRNVARDQAEQLRDVRGIDVLTGPSRSVEFLQMNSLPNSPAAPLRDVRVRQAIAHAIDRQTIANYVLGPGAKVLHAECHPSTFGCDDTNVPRYAYDPAKARALLAEAGYKNGFDIDLYAYTNRVHAEAVMGYLGAVGIRAHLRYLRTAAVIDAVRAGRVALLQQSLVTGEDPAMGGLTRSYGFGPEDLSHDAEVRDVLLRGDTSMDANVRKQAYTKGLGLIAERAYTVPLYSEPAYYIAAKGLAFTPPADQFPRFYEMSWK